jgi:hypothetical protein
MARRGRGIGAVAVAELAAAVMVAELAAAVMVAELAAAVMVAGLLAAAPAGASPCTGAKLDAVGRAASCAIALEAKEARTARAVDPAKLARCSERLARAFAKAEAKPPCETTGDAAALGETADGFVLLADAALAVDLPNACAAKKLAATGALASCRLGAEAKAAKKDVAASGARIAACDDKHAKAFARAEWKTCATTGDAAALASAAADLVTAAKDALAVPDPPDPPGTLSLDDWTYVAVSGDHALTYGLDAADLDGDGARDLVSGRYWYASPGGALTGAWTRSAAFPDGLHAMLAVDVDGDDRADLIGQADSGTAVAWLEATNAEATAWSATAIGTLPASPHAQGMQGFRLAQIEAGGRLEVALSSGAGLFYFRIPAANAGAGSWPRVRISASPSDEGFAFGDLDGDGDLDVVAGTADGERVEWYRNPGDSGADWTAFPLGDVSDFGFPDRFELGDLDGDDDLDVIGSEENGATSGAKTVWWEHPASATAPGWTRRPIATQATTNSLDVADLDGDGDVDVVTGEHRGTKQVTIFANDGTGLAWTAHPVDAGKESHLGVQLFDLDGDGDLDVVSIAWDASEKVHLWRNDAITD